MTAATATADPRPKHLIEGETAVTAAAERVTAAWARLDELQAARVSLNTQIAAEPDDKRLEKLRRERREIAAELGQAPHDVVGASEKYATTLVRWASDTWNWAQIEIHHAQRELEEPARAAARAQRTLDPGRPAESRNPDADAAAQAALNDLAGPINASAQRIREARVYAGTARVRTERHFGDTVNGTLATLDAIPQWLAGIRRRAQERAGTNH